MRTLRRGLAPLAVTLILVAALSSACASSFLGKSYQTVGTIHVTVDTGMKVYADLVVAGKVTQATQDQVRKAYGTYAAAYQVVGDALIAYAKGTQTDKVAAQRAIDALTASSVDILALLRALGVKV
jgi:hypothetical protein